MTGKVLVPLKLEKLEDLRFGDVVRGNKNIKNKVDGKVKVTGEGKVLLTWRDSERLEYTEMQNDLDINLKNRIGNEKITASISALNIDKSIIELEKNSEKVITFQGKISEVSNKISVGEYRGTVVIRAEYINIE